MLGFLLLTSPAQAARLLPLGGAVTETVFALGSGPEVIGTDLTSLYPQAAAALPRVGYLRALGAEGILSLAPDLILASADAGRPSVMRQVAEAGVKIVTLPEAHAPEATLDRVRLVGAATGHAGQAGAMADTIAADLAAVRADIARAASKPRVVFLLSVGRGAAQAAGTHTAADAMIRLAGGENAMGDMRGYRPLSAESALIADPEIIVTTNDTLRAAGGRDGLLSASALSQTTAGRQGRVAAFDALLLLGFGPRLAQATRDLAVALHPEASFAPLPPRAWAPE